MASARVVPTFDVAEQRKPRLGFRPEASAVDQLAFEAREEALRHRVVVGVAHAARRGPNAELCTALAEGNAGVLGGFNPSSQHILIGGCDAYREETGRSS